jgi:hypothetical protein
MNTWVKVARYHLVRPTAFGIPWFNLAFAFFVALVIFAEIPVGQDTSGRWTGAVASMFATFFAVSVQTIGRSLPLGLMFGVSRRSYYMGTALTGMAMAAVNAAGITVLQAIERASSGWGVHMNFFRVPYIMDGPWYATLLTSFVALTMLFLYGMWYGIVYRRWGLFGTITFVAAQVLVVLAGVLSATWTHSWPSVGGFFTSLTALGLTSILAALAAVLLAGGQVTVRRAAV